MVSQTSLSTHTDNTATEIVTLSRFINRRVVTIEFNGNIPVKELVVYFQLNDDEFYQVRKR